MNDETREEALLGRGLTALAEHDAPAATVTVEGVIEAGRRQVRTRRGRTAFALSAVLVACVAIALGVLAMSSTGSSATPVVSPDVTGIASIGAGADVLAPTAAFGWLPAALNDASMDVLFSGPGSLGAGT